MPSMHSPVPLLCIALALAPSILIIGSCALVTPRPVQQMSLTSAAIRAAREMQADTLAPDLYRQANDWFNRAKIQYRLKNFQQAQDAADRARDLAERAEFEAARSGANRIEQGGPDPLGNGVPNNPAPATPEPQPTPYEYPTPVGIPADAYDARKAQEIPNPSPSGAPAPQSPANPPNPRSGR